MAAYIGAVELAWTLAVSIDEHLPGQERDRVYVALGGGTLISAIPVAPEPHRTTSRQKTNYLRTARDHRRTDSNPQTAGSA
jgi:hypothetical protein